MEDTVRHTVGDKLGESRKQGGKAPDKTKRQTRFQKTQRAQTPSRRQSGRQSGRQGSKDLGGRHSATHSVPEPCAQMPEEGERDTTPRSQRLKPNAPNSRSQSGRQRETRQENTMRTKASLPFCCHCALVCGSAAEGKRYCMKTM